MQAWQIETFGVNELKQVECATPAPGPGEVLVRVRAVSFNYRDLMVVKGLYNPKMKLPRMLEHRFGDTEFALRHMLKDARYATTLAKELGMDPALVLAAATVFARAETKGLGDLDFSAVLEGVA